MHQIHVGVVELSHQDENVKSIEQTKADEEPKVETIIATDLQD